MPSPSDILRLPLFDGKITTQPYRVIDPWDGLLIEPGPDSVVRSCTRGKVLSNGKIDSSFEVLIKSDDPYYAYSSLDSSSVSTGEMIYSGEPIGVLKRNGINQSLFFCCL